MQGGNELSEGFEETLVEKLQKFEGKNKDADSIIGLVAAAAENCADSTRPAFWKNVFDLFLDNCVDEPYIYLHITLRLIEAFIIDKDFQASAHDAIIVRVAENLHCSPDRREPCGSGENSGIAQEKKRLTQNFCQFISALCIHDWSGPFKSSIRSRNALLYAALSAVHTWSDYVEKALTENGDQKEECNDVDGQTLRVEWSCRCIIYVGSHAGRKFWLKWPDVVDRLYSIVRMAIVTNKAHLISERMKTKLLDFYVKINDWPKKINNYKNVPKSSDSSTQTAFTGSNGAFDLAGMQMSLPKSRTQKQRWNRTVC